MRANKDDSLEVGNHKPKVFDFLTNVPRDLLQIPKLSFSKKNLKGLSIVVGSSLVLIVIDQPIFDGVRNFSDNINLSPHEKNKDIWTINIGHKETVLLKVPKNLNTFFYNLGQGFTTVLIASGFFIQGKISKNVSSLQTASDLVESFITLGVATQTLKYISGRQNPSDATRRGGRWQPFPSLSSFQNSKSNYDAFPSGHIATLMATVTILSNNYPQKKWIRPIGYTIVALSGFAMINNGVHWAGDYPLAVGLGYLTGYIITERHKRIRKIDTGCACSF